jgi:hypothetical protein
MHLRFRVDERELAISRLDPGDAVPLWATAGAFFSVTRSARELSIVCEDALVPPGVRHERGWATLELEGPFPFELTGILASFLAPLAEAKIGIFALSTFDTDLVLVKRDALDAARCALAAAGHEEIS